VNDTVLPLESDPASQDGHENIREALLAEIREKATAQGLWAFQMPISRGGQGVGVVGMAALYEEMNRSIFGPACFNAAAPDDGNMILLNKVGTEAQKDRWLQPIIDGKLRSAFVMTEPHPGSGSDPSGMMLTKAEKVQGGWRIKGCKWFITGADGAQHFILVARTSDDPRKGLTALLFDADQPGWRIERRIPIMGPGEHGGYCEIEFDGLEVADENVLMGVGDGLKTTQIRLGTARLTHCMRWLGLSKRLMEIARECIRTREAFGSFLGDRESVQTAMGKIAMDIQVGRLLVMNAAWKLDQGDFARKEVSMARSPWPICCTMQWTRPLNWMARADIPRTRCWNGSTAMPVRRGWWMAPARCTRWCCRVSTGARAMISGAGGFDGLGSAVGLS
jgi:acyl-CoA dehydrogenase